MSETQFDVDAWISSAKPPTRSCAVYGRADLVAKFETLHRQADALDASQPASFAGAPGNDLRERASEMRAQIEASALTVVVRGMMLEERRDLAELHKDDDPTALRYTTEAVALCMLEPVMTNAQVSRLRSAIGETQWADIVAALEAASGESIDVPLSRAGSAARTTSGS